MSVAEAQSKISSTEFVQWRIYLGEEPNHFNPLFYYLAQIAREIRVTSGHKKGARLPRVADFIIRFSKSTAPARIKESKGTWLGWLGIKKEGRN